MVELNALEKKGCKVTTTSFVASSTIIIIFVYWLVVIRNFS